VADKDEEWTGPVTEASQPLGERLETLEAGGTPDNVTEAFPPIEERVARLERIAEYLHDARNEAATLASSVDTLAEATKALTELLIAIEAQQQRIEKLDDRVGASEVTTEAFRKRVVKRAVIAGAVVVVLSLIVGGTLLFLQRTQAADEVDAVWRCEARNEQSEIIVDILRGALVERGNVPDNPQTQIIRQGLGRFEALIVDCEGVTL